jgi:hypothetical protein
MQLTEKLVIRLLAFLGLSLHCPGPSFAIDISPTPNAFILDGRVAEWTSLPPATEVGVEHHRDSPHYALWVGRTNRGLVVAGRLRNSQLSFANDTAELNHGDRIEIRLSVSEPFELPPLSYTEEYCRSVAATETERAGCLEWIKDQRVFHQRIHKLFSRLWRIAPAAADESLALPAYDAMSRSQHAALDFPRPSDLPERRFQTGTGGAITFEVFISWDLFPPANRLSLDRIRFRADLTSGSSPHISTDPTALGRMEPAEPPAVSVSPAITSRLTPCEQSLFARDYAGNDQPVFYFLRRSLEVSRTFLLQEPAVPYLAHLPQSGRISVIASPHVFFAQEMGTGEFLCGPFMSYRNGSIVKRFPFRLEPDRDEVSWTPIRSFPIKRLPDGTRLIRYGPDKASGPLWRHAWICYSMRVYALTPSLQVRRVLDLYAQYDGPEGYEIEISDDWRTVKEFFGNEGKWTTRTHCLMDQAYRVCKEDADSAPPRKRILTPEQ